MERSYWSRRFGRRNFIRSASVAAVGGLGAVAVGCGSDDDDDPGTGATAPAGSPSTGGSGGRKEGDRVRVAIGAEPTTVDPHNYIGGVDNFYLNQMFNALVEIDQAGKPYMALAESAEVAPDGSQVTFKLRQGVTFHNGDPLTAKDVVYSFNRAMSPEAKGTKTLFVNVDKAEALDDATFVYKMKKPDAAFILGLYGGLRILPEAYTEKAGFDGFSNAPVGTGAYKFKSRTIGTGASFERFDDYFQGKAAFKTAEMRLVPDGTSRVQMLQVGEVDVVAAIPPEQVRLAKGISGVKLVTQPANIDTYFGFNIKNVPGAAQGETFRLLGDKRVRQAINHSVDKKAIAEKIYGAEFARPYAVTAPDQPWHINKEYAFDLKKAKDLLSAAGASDLKLTQYMLSGGRLPGLQPLGAAVASNIRDAGIDVTEAADEYNAWLSRLRNDTPPYPDEGMIFSWASTAGYQDPFSGPDSKWLSSARYGWWADSKFDDLLGKARTTFVEEERTAILKETFNYMFDEAPALWVVLLDEAYGIRTDVVSNWRPRTGATPVIRLEDLDA